MEFPTKKPSSCGRHQGTLHVLRERMAVQPYPCKPWFPFICRGHGVHHLASIFTHLRKVLRHGWHACSVTSYGSFHPVAGGQTVMSFVSMISTVFNRIVRYRCSRHKTRYPLSRVQASWVASVQRPPSPTRTPSHLQQVATSLHMGDNVHKSTHIVSMSLNGTSNLSVSISTSRTKPTTRLFIGPCDLFDGGEVYYKALGAIILPR